MTILSNSKKKGIVKLYGRKYRKYGEKAFKITSADLKEKVEAYLESGGKITHIEEEPRGHKPHIFEGADHYLQE